jgi:G3E family GTPase
MPRYSVEISQRFEDALARLTEDDQDEVLRIVGMLQVDPSIDAIRRHVLQTPYGAIQFYDGDDVWVSYRLRGNDVVWIINCGRYSAPPPLM